MNSSTALTDPADRAAAISRHPSARLRPGSGKAVRPAGAGCSFSALVELLTGTWRAQDPHGFAAAMTGAPLVGGHAVLDVALLGEAAGTGDAWSAQASERLRATLAGAASRLEPRWVAGDRPDGDGGRHVFVEARGEAGADGEEPALFVVAHLVERLGPGGERSRGRCDHSWVVVVTGDPSGRVTTVLRAVLACPGGCCRPIPGWARLPLAALRERLVGPALGTIVAPAGDRRAEVIPLRRR